MQIHTFLGFAFLFPLKNVTDVLWCNLFESHTLLFHCLSYLFAPLFALDCRNYFLLYYEYVFNYYLSHVNIIIFLISTKYY